MNYGLKNLHSSAEYREGEGALLTDYNSWKLGEIVKYIRNKTLKSTTIALILIIFW